MTLLGIEPRRIPQEQPEVGLAALLRDLGQVRRVVRPLSQQRVAVDAVLPVPHVLAGDHLRRDGLGVRQLAESHVAVNGQPDEDRREDAGADDEEQPRLPFGHSDLRIETAGLRLACAGVQREPDWNTDDVVSDADPRKIEDGDPG